MQSHLEISKACESSRPRSTLARMGSELSPRAQMTNPVQLLIFGLTMFTSALCVRALVLGLGTALHLFVAAAWMWLLLVIGALIEAVADDLPEARERSAAESDGAALRGLFRLRRASGEQHHWPGNPTHHAR
jgi:high-affinity K+ transport system ATPase subunit B